MATSVLCTATAIQAEAIASALRSAGFPRDDISILMSDRRNSRDFLIQNETKAPEGASTGASAGAIFGGSLGWLAGIGAIGTPGLGPLLAAGPIMAALSGVAVGGVLGGVTGALVGLGIPEFEAKRFEGKVRIGRCLISVHTESSDEVDVVKEIFDQVGAEDIATSWEAAVPYPYQE